MYVTTNEYDLWVNDSSSVGFVSDYNIFWNSSSQDPFKYIGTAYATIAAYRAASGQDAHSLQSDPPLPASDIVSLLVTGRTIDEVQDAQSEVARDQRLGYLSGDVLGFAGRAVGLDTFKLERGLAQDTVHTDLALFAGEEDHRRD